ncbi:MAG: hypothetical protein JKY59_07095, partial [Emcibacter sp.]|nr:hypothetical protein [Emcibacter sp.]
MELKYKLLAVVSTLALSTWAYNDLIGNESSQKALQDQIDLLTINEKMAMDSSIQSDPSGIIVANPESARNRPTALPITALKTTLVPQGTTYSQPAIAPVLSHNSQAMPRSQIVPQKIEPITLEEAVYAAIDGSEESLRILQQYFDRSAGQQDRITHLASAVLSGLGASGLVENDHNLQDAAARVIDAAARSATSAYSMPFASISDFGLSFGDTGWDFGPVQKIPHRGFIRITPASGSIDGSGLVALQASKENDFLKDGILNVRAFGIPEVAKGHYRLYVFTTALPSGTKVSHPFGNRFGVNGHQIRVIDTAKTDNPQWAKLSANGVSLVGTEGNKPNSDLMPVSLGFEQKNDVGGWLLTTLIKGDDQTINMKFESDGPSETYIVGVILSPVDISDMEDDLNEQLFAMLQNLAPGGTAATGRVFNNDFTAETLNQFFVTPNTRSALGPNARELDGFGGTSALSNGGGDNGGGDNGGGDNGGGDNGGGDNGGGDNGGG